VDDPEVGAGTQVAAGNAALNDRTQRFPARLNDLLAVDAPELRMRRNL
jgi:hypothetical protein